MYEENAITLNKEHIKNINYSDVIAITIAEEGAMGEENAFQAVLKDLTTYYINLEDTDISTKEFHNAFPVMKEFSCFFGKVKYPDKDWVCVYMGYGNYLLVRHEYETSLNKYLKDNFKDGYVNGELYQSWYSVIKNITENKKINKRK